MSDFTEKVLAMLDAAKQGNWSFCRYAETDRECLKKEIGNLLDNEGAGDVCYFVGTDDDLVIALAGNGPTSAQNAELISAAPTILREACERIEELEKVADAIAAADELARSVAGMFTHGHALNGTHAGVVKEAAKAYQEARHV